MGDGTDGPRILLWCMAVLGWPLFTYQLYCLFAQRPVPLLGRQYGVQPIDPTSPITGQANPDATNLILIALALEGALFLVVTALAYTRSGYGRG